jgi:hypothetical protein
VTGCVFGLFGADVGSSVDNLRRCRDEVMAKVL